MIIPNIIEQCLDLGVQLSTDGKSLNVDGNQGLLSPQLISLLKNNKEQLIEYISQFTQIEQQKSQMQVLVADRNKDLPLSSSQKRLWVLDQIHGQSSHYNMASSFWLEGSFNLSTAQQAMKMLVARHEVLRTNFKQVNGEPVQIISNGEACIFSYQDLSHLSLSDSEDIVMRLAAEDATKPFDLTKDVMIRMGFLRQADNKGALFFSMHHIAADGWSIGIIHKEFVSIYNALTNGLALKLAPLPVQYADYACWQNKMFEQQDFKHQLGYWQNQLADLPGVHSLPLDKVRPKQLGNAGDYSSVSISKSTSLALNKLALKFNTTLFIVMHTLVSILLSRYANNHDVVVGTPVAGRKQKELEGLIGFFINSIVLRVDTSGNPTFEELVQQVKQVNLDAQDNQDVPFEYLVEALNPTRTTSHQELFQIMLVQNKLQIHGSEAPKLGDAVLTGFDTIESNAKYELQINVVDQEDHIDISFAFNKDLFSKSIIDQMVKHFVNLCDSVLINPEEQIDRLTFLDDLELTSLVGDFNAGLLQNSSVQPVNRYVEAIAYAKPDSLAATFDNVVLTYGELNRQANQVAHLLKNKGVQSESLIGLAVHKSTDMLVAMLAILKVGGAYVPIDPAYPDQRIKYMLEDAAVDLLLTQTSLENRFNQFSCQKVVLDNFELKQELSLLKTENLTDTKHGNATDLAYVIYTSGSTGEPKGVMVEHQNIVRLVKNIDYIDITANDRLALISNISFDAATFEIWGALCNGASLHHISHESVLEPTKLTREIADKKISTMFVTTALFNQVALSKPSGFATLKNLLLGGEAIDKQCVDKVLKAGKPNRLINCYGPTENTTFSTCYEINQTETRNYPIGKGIANTQCFILDDFLRPVGRGMVGELYLAGPGVTRGYLNRTQLTNERFVKISLNSENSIRMYKSGDLVRWTDDLQLQFVGRTDHQVKIRGFRIELGEIEQILLGQKEIAEAIVIVHGSSAGNNQLAAYITLDCDKGVNQSDIKGLLANILPDYMLPKSIIILDKMPINANGKIDRAALPSPVFNDVTEVTKPSTETECKLVNAWSRLLDVTSDKIGVLDNFFNIGGHSLLAVKLISEIKHVFAKEVSVKAIFEHPTIRLLSTYIESINKLEFHKTLKRVDREQKIFPLSFPQQRLWFIDQLQSGSPEYNLPAAYYVTGDFNLDAAEKSITNIISRHEVLRTTYEESLNGPVQRICDDFAFKIKVLNLSHYSETDKQLKLQEVIDLDVKKSFDLSKDLMVRASFILLDDSNQPEKKRGALLFNIHHIATDGWSMDILTKEFTANYNAIVNNDVTPFTPLKNQYADYAHWQRQWLQGEVLDEQLAYWETQLSGVDPVHGLTLDFPRPDSKRHNGDSLIGELSADVSQSLQKLAKKHQLTPFMLLHAALSLVIAQHSNSTDIVIGTPVANRLQAELEPLIGFFVNTLVLRVNTGFETIDTYFEHVRQVHLDAQSNQDVPFEQLVERLNIPRSTSHGPLFQISLTTNTDFSIGNETANINLADVAITPLSPSSVTTKFDLNIDIAISDTGVNLNWIFDTSIFTHSHIAQFNDHMCRLLTALSNSCDRDSVKLTGLPILSTAETQYLTSEINNAQQKFPQHLCIQELFESQVEINSQATALRFENSSITYDELNQKANKLAHYLLDKHNVTPDFLIGICVERSIEMVIGILAVLKAGAAYVPIDPSYPDSRISHIINDAELEVILTQSWLIDQVNLEKTIRIQLDSEEFESSPSSNISTKKLGLSPKNLAYIIYTSGSTGKPKGVAIRHSNTSAMLHWANSTFSKSELSKVLASTSLNFDLSIFELFVPLCFGHQSIIVKSALTLIDNALDVTLINTVPSAMNTLLEHDAVPDSVKTINLAGEPLAAQLVNCILKETQVTSVCNLYGPSEDTTYSTYTRFNQPINITPPIGKVISNSQGLILRESLTLVPYGVTGELYLTGEGLAKEYLNQPELTESSFIDNPYYKPGQPLSYKKLYKTGDLVRYLADGNLDFIGRIDDQVKIRGFRIELGEVAHQLSHHSVVESATVLVKENGNGSKQLVAYLKSEVVGCPDFDGAKLTTEIKQQLKNTLPEYMIPSSFVFVENWPLTPNGKIDKKSLSQQVQKNNEVKFQVAATETETLLIEIWSDLLSIEKSKLSTNANFFDLGGHSLIAMSLIKKVQQQLGKSIPVRKIFEYQNVIELSAYLDHVESGVNILDTQSTLIQLREGDSNVAPVFLIHPVGGMALCYADLFAGLNENIPVYGLQSTSVTDCSLSELAQIYQQEIKTVWPTGNINVIGWSMGGVIGQELQSLSASQFDDNVSLIMLDSYVPDQRLTQPNDLDLLMVLANEIQIDLSDVDFSQLRQLTTVTLLHKLHEMALAQEKFPSDFTFEQLNKRWMIISKNQERFSSHRMNKALGPSVLITAENAQAARNWDKYISQLEILSLPDTDHFTIVRKPNVIAIQKIIEKVFYPEMKLKVAS